MIEIRDARPDEYAEVGEVTVRGYGHGEDNETNSYLQLLRDVPTRAKSTDIIIALLDGAIVGACAYPHKGGPYEDIAFAPNEAEFRMLTTVDEARGHGIGVKLTNECLRRARRDGRTHMVISVAPNNGPAEHIYKKLGFQRAPARDWTAADDFALQAWVLALVKYCGICGEDIAGTHDHRGQDLEPDRFCHYCARRLQVQIRPTDSITKPCICTTEV